MDLSALFVGIAWVVSPCTSDFGMTEILRWRIQRSSMVPWRFCAPLSIWYWQEQALDSWRSISCCTVQLVVSKLCTFTVSLNTYTMHQQLKDRVCTLAGTGLKRLPCCCFRSRLGMHYQFWRWGIWVEYLPLRTGPCATWTASQMWTLWLIWGCHRRCVCQLELAENSWKHMFWDTNKAWKEIIWNNTSCYSTKTTARHRFFNNNEI